MSRLGIDKETEESSFSSPLKQVKSRKLWEPESGMSDVYTSIGTTSRPFDLTEPIIGQDGSAFQHLDFRKLVDDLENEKQITHRTPGPKPRSNSANFQSESGRDPFEHGFSLSNVLELHDTIDECLQKPSEFQKKQLSSNFHSGGDDPSFYGNSMAPNAARSEEYFDGFEPDRNSTRSFSSIMGRNEGLPLEMGSLLHNLTSGNTPSTGTETSPSKTNSLSYNNVGFQIDQNRTITNKNYISSDFSPNPEFLPMPQELTNSHEGISNDILTSSFEDPIFPPRLTRSPPRFRKEVNRPATNILPGSEFLYPNNSNHQVPMGQSFGPPSAPQNSNSNIQINNHTQQLLGSNVSNNNNSNQNILNRNPQSILSLSDNSPNQQYRNIVGNLPQPQYHSQDSNPFTKFPPPPPIPQSGPMNTNHATMMSSSGHQFDYSAAMGYPSQGGMSMSLPGSVAGTGSGQSSTSFFQYTQGHGPHPTSLSLSSNVTPSQSSSLSQPPPLSQSLPAPLRAALPATSYMSYHGLSQSQSASIAASSSAYMHTMQQQSQTQPSFRQNMNAMSMANAPQFAGNSFFIDQEPTRNNNNKSSKVMNGIGNAKTNSSNNMFVNSFENMDLRNTDLRKSGNNNSLNMNGSVSNSSNNNNSNVFPVQNNINNMYDTNVTPGTYQNSINQNSIKGMKISGPGQSIGYGSLFQPPHSIPPTSTSNSYMMNSTKTSANPSFYPQSSMTSLSQGNPSQNPLGAFQQPQGPNPPYGYTFEPPDLSSTGQNMSTSANGFVNMRGNTSVNTGAGSIGTLNKPRSSNNLSSKSSMSQGVYPNLSGGPHMSAPGSSTSTGTGNSSNTNNNLATNKKQKSRPASAERFPANSNSGMSMVPRDGPSSAGSASGNRSQTTDSSGPNSRMQMNTTNSTNDSTTNAPGNDASSGQGKGGALKEFYLQFHLKEKESSDAAREYADEALKWVPEDLKWKVLLELADLAKKNNQFVKAGELYNDVSKRQPQASQAWLEWSKMEDELGNIDSSVEILREGLRKCTFNEALFTKALKQVERLHNLRLAREMLSALKYEPIGLAWKAVLEGSLLEARAGEIATARKFLKYLMAHVSWYGPIYFEAFRLEEKCENWHAACAIVEKGLSVNSKYGPLWFGLLRLMERFDALEEKGKWLQGIAPTLRRVRDRAQYAVQCISRELVWKVHFEQAQAEERAAEFAALGLHTRTGQPLTVTRDHLLNDARMCYVRSLLICPSNLRWKAWLAGARMELSAGRIFEVRRLLRWALYEAPEKSRSHVLLECSRVEEYLGNLDTARKILSRARADDKCDWKVYLETVLLESRAGNLREAIIEAEKALKQDSGTGRLWAVLVQLTHRLECLQCSESAVGGFAELLGKIYDSSGGSLSAVSESDASSQTTSVSGSSGSEQASSGAQGPNFTHTLRVEDKLLGIIKPKAVHPAATSHLQPSLSSQQQQQPQQQQQQMVQTQLHQHVVASESDTASISTQTTIESYDALFHPQGHQDRCLRSSSSLSSIKKKGSPKHTVLLRALFEVPKSGEVWCEAARCHMNPLQIESFDLSKAQKYLGFAILFTPQYGDTFIEYLRLEFICQIVLPIILLQLHIPIQQFSQRFLSEDTEADIAEITRDGRSLRGLLDELVSYQIIEFSREKRQRNIKDMLSYEFNIENCVQSFKYIKLKNLYRRCTNADPNYGTVWFFCRQRPIDNPNTVMDYALQLLCHELTDTLPLYVRACCQFVRNCLEMKNSTGSPRHGHKRAGSGNLHSLKSKTQPLPKSLYPNLKKRPSSAPTQTGRITSPNPYSTSTSSEAVTESESSTSYELVANSGQTDVTSTSNDALLSNISSEGAGPMVLNESTEIEKEILDDYHDVYKHLSSLHFPLQETYRNIPVISIHNSLFFSSDFVTSIIKLNRAGYTRHLSAEEKRKVLFGSDQIIP